MGQAPYRKLLGFLWSILVVAGIFLPLQAFSSGLQVSPVRVELARGQVSEKLVLKNTSSYEVIVEARAYRWEQEAGEDRLLPTQAIALSGEIFFLQPGQSQVILLGLLETPTPESGEVSYRMILRSDPTPGAAAHTGAKVSLSISIPIFVAPSEKGTPGLSVDLRKGEGTKVLIYLKNESARYVRLQKLYFREADGTSHMEMPLNSYLLPGKGDLLVISKTDIPKSGSVSLDYLWGGTPEALHSRDLDLSPLGEKPDKVSSHASVPPSP